MDIKSLLQQQGWKIAVRRDWIAVEDTSSALTRYSPTGRVGKIINTDFYVTLVELDVEIRSLVAAMGTSVKTIKSSNRARDVEYVGFDTSKVSRIQLQGFVEALHAAVNNLKAQVKRG